MNTLVYAIPAALVLLVVIFRWRTTPPQALWLRITYVLLAAIAIIVATCVARGIPLTFPIRMAMLLPVILTYIISRAKREPQTFVQLKQMQAQTGEKIG